MASLCSRTCRPYDQDEDNAIYILYSLVHLLNKTKIIIITRSIRHEKWIWGWLKDCHEGVKGSRRKKNLPEHLNYTLKIRSNKFFNSTAIIIYKFKGKKKNIIKTKWTCLLFASSTHFSPPPHSLKNMLPRNK